MKQTARIISIHAADTSGVCSMLYELGGMVVVHDASGCNSTYSTHDEPRWYRQDSMIYISALTETDAILGNDEKLISDIAAAARDLSPRFIAVCGAPVPLLAGTDFTAIITVANVSGVKDYSNLALTEAIPSGWEIFNDRLAGGGSGKVDYSYRDIRDDRVIWFFDLPKGTSKTFRVKLHAAYEGEFVLPAVKCEAMYDSKVSANTASGTARVSK